MGVKLKELCQFLVKAKIQTYAGDGKRVEPERSDFKELEFSEGEWCYRDSYTGFYRAPGQEVVRYKGKPIWIMSYSGGMKPKYHEKLKFSKQTYNFLKEALKRVKVSSPFRGPESFKKGDYEYINKVEGNVKAFKGEEKIFYKGEEVFSQDYIGGLIVDEVKKS
ncbi:MAG: hypothetical protein GF368_01890 [Candidatus Aenigmarchaeota archaeon]|nr:hypothetical protein [Candidatus Aenigmarchaeota archaeon]